MKTLKNLYMKASKEYNGQKPHYETCLQLVLHCHQKLSTESVFREYGSFSGHPPVPYSVFELNGAVSRPVRSDLYIAADQEFGAAHAQTLDILSTPEHVWTPQEYDNANKIVYTSIMAFASCIDLWQRSSRKTPGTFFEVFMAGLLQKTFPNFIFSKHISLADILDDAEVVQEPDVVNEGTDSAEHEGKASVSTDVVMGIPGQHGGVVIPLKITTRERIVQPFAHQRILDAAFGEGHYQSLIVCISETQLAEKTKSVNQVCVPGTIKLFQKHLAHISGLYYCDLPQRYIAEDMTRIINVRSVGHLFEDIRAIMKALTKPATTD